MLRAQALELFFSDSHELFLNFLEGHKERNRFYAKLRNSCKVSCMHPHCTMFYAITHYLLSTLGTFAILSKVIEPPSCIQKIKGDRALEEKKNFKF